MDVNIKFEELKEACINGRLDIMKSIYNKFNLNLSSEKEILFTYAVKYNRLNIIKWLLEVKPDILVDIYDNSPLRESVIYGNLEIFNFLLNLTEDKYEHRPKLYRDLFVTACWYEKKYMAEHILNLYPELNNIENFNIAFILCCEIGHLDIVKFLCEKK